MVQQRLKSIPGFYNSPMMNAVEAYIQFKPDLIPDSGEVSVPGTENFLRNSMQEFRVFIGRVLIVYPCAGLGTSQRTAFGRGGQITAAIRRNLMAGGD